MATAARALQAVRPHIPRIHFPNRKLPQGATDMPVVPVAATSITNPSAMTTPSSVGKVGESPRGSGIDFRDLPARYRRRPLEDIEIEYVLRGGPE